MMTEQEWRMANKVYCLNFGYGTEHQRKKLEYEVKHFEDRLAKKGRRIEYRFHMEGPAVITAHIY